MYALADEIIRHAADVIVVEPAELRNEVLSGLRAVAARQRQQAGAA
jgi:hypothetical protein